jgi:hypothetical protein
MFCKQCGAPNSEDARFCNRCNFDPYRGVSDNPNFYVNKNKKTVIIFNHYEFAPYSSGFLEFELPN